MALQVPWLQQRRTEAWNEPWNLFSCRKRETTLAALKGITDGQSVFLGSGLGDGLGGVNFEYLVILNTW